MNKIRTTLSPMVSELYRFGKAGDWCYDAIVKYIRLRYRLLPYTYSSAADCVLHSGTMMRALVMDFANDRHAATLNSEYLFGRSLLVKPVTDPMYTWKDSKKRGHLIYPNVSKAAAPTTVYLPKGTQWYDFWDDQPHAGGQTIQRLCPSALSTSCRYMSRPVPSCLLAPTYNTVQRSLGMIWR